MKIIHFKGKYHEPGQHYMDMVHILPVTIWSKYCRKIEFDNILVLLPFTVKLLFKFILTENRPLVFFFIISDTIY